MKWKITRLFEDWGIAERQFVAGNIMMIIKYHRIGKKDTLSVYKDNKLTKEICWDYNDQYINIVRTFDGNRNSVTLYTNAGRKRHYEEWANNVKHGKDIFFYNDKEGKSVWFFLYGKRVSERAYRKHQLIEELSGI